MILGLPFANHDAYSKTNWMLNTNQTLYVPHVSSSRFHSLLHLQHGCLANEIPTNIILFARTIVDKVSLY